MIMFSVDLSGAIAVESQCTDPDYG